MKHILTSLCALVLVACGSGSSKGSTQDTIAQSATSSASSLNANQSSSAPAESETQATTLHVAVLMGAHSKSRLYIQGSEVWWLHIDGVVPGLSGIRRGSVQLNDNYWKPEWPEEGDNPFCLCESLRESLPPINFTESIAIQGITGGSVHILRQALNSSSMETILEIENRSGEDGWVNFTIVPASEVDDKAQHSVIETTYVDDLDMPEINAEAKELFESQRALAERFNDIIDENITLALDNQTTKIAIRGFVPRNAWVTQFAKLFPPEVCQSTELLTECYEVSTYECEWILGNETKRCLNQYYEQMPTTFIQPNDGGIWGETIGGCAGDAYAFLLSDWKLPSCDRLDGSASEVMKKISGTIQGGRNLKLSN